MEVTGSELSPQRCGEVGEVLGRIGERWTLRVAFGLRHGPVRFNQLRRTIPGISQQMLTRTLKALERDGMLTRTVHPSVPPQVEYALTPLGESLVAEGMRLGSWAYTHLRAIGDSRAAYDRGEDARG